MGLSLEYLSSPIRSERLKRFGHSPAHSHRWAVFFISLPCSFALGLGLTEALHVGPYQRDLELSPARFRVGVSLPPCGFFHTQFTPNSYAILTRVYFAYDFICSFASSVLRNGVGENRPTLHRLHKWVLHRLTHIR